MSRKLFTDAQVKKLTKNKWIKNITNKGITYTNDFKYKLVKECENYKKFPQDVFRECGIEPEIVGMRRIESSAYRWRKQLNSIGEIKDKEKWKTVKTLAYVKIQIMTGDEIKVTDNYYVIDYQININDLENAIKDYWNIECGLHWRLDVIMNEDHSRNREKNSVLNLSTLRKMAFNLASLDTSFGKVPLQKKLTRYMLDFKNIEKLIFEVIPTMNSCQ